MPSLSLVYRASAGFFSRLLRPLKGGKVQSQAAMEVTKENFSYVLPTVIAAIDDAAFVAIDGEFTGIGGEANKMSPYDTVEERYEKVILPLGRQFCPESLHKSFCRRRTARGSSFWSSSGSALSTTTPSRTSTRTGRSTSTSGRGRTTTPRPTRPSSRGRAASTSSSARSSTSTSCSGRESVT